MPQTSMGFEDFIRLVLDALKAADVEYMIGGSVAVWAWGEARTTRDVDIVIHLPVEKMGWLSQELAKRDMLVPHDVILDIFLETRTDLPVNAIHLGTGNKAELFLMRPDDEYREVAFVRRQLVDMGPPLGEVWVHAPEDLIINKLRYLKISHQQKHVRDIKSILAERHQELDMDYMEEWIVHFQLAEQWQEVQE